MLALPFLMNVLGFSETCAGEITSIVPMLPGALLAWWGRFRQGDITLGGFKKN